MRTFASILFLSTILFTQACTYVPEVEPTDISPATWQSATREEIEETTGEPALTHASDEGVIEIYTYRLGTEGGYAGIPPPRDPDAVLLWLELAPLAWAATPLLYAHRATERDGRLAIIYDEDGRIARYQIGQNTELLRTALQSEEGIAFYFDEHAEEMQEQLTDYTLSNNLLISNMSYQSAKVTNIHSVDVQRIDGRDVDALVSYTFGEWVNTTHGTFLFNLRWVGSRLRVVGHEDTSDTALPVAINSDDARRSRRWWENTLNSENRQFSIHLRKYTEQHNLLLTDSYMMNTAVIQAVNVLYASSDTTVAEITYDFGNIRWAGSTARGTVLFEIKRVGDNAEIANHGEAARAQYWLLVEEDQT